MISNRQVLRIKTEVIAERLYIQPPFHHKVIFPDEACLLFVANGWLKLESVEGVQELHTGKNLLLKCGIYFADILEEANQDPVTVIAIHLPQALLKKLIQSEQSFFSEHSVKSSSTNTEIAGRALAAFLQSLTIYFDEPTIQTDALITTKLRELLLLLVQSQYAGSLKELLESMFSPQRASFMEMVEAHIFTRATIEDMAALSGMSLSSFKRKFTSIYKESPAQYLQSRKIQEARKLLLHSSLTISEIAYQTGFQDPSHFTKVFRKWSGQTPVAYRTNKPETEPKEPEIEPN